MAKPILGIENFGCMIAELTEHAVRRILVGPDRNQFPIGAVMDDHPTPCRANAAQGPPLIFWQCHTDLSPEKVDCIAGMICNLLNSPCPRSYRDP
jgi:hypothetical protein